MWVGTSFKSRGPDIVCMCVGGKVSKHTCKQNGKLEYSQRYNVVGRLSVRDSIILPLCIAVSRPGQ